MRFIFFIIFFIGLLNAQSLIEPVPESVKYNKEKAELGGILFFDTSFSLDKKTSCASCHNPAEGWADRDIVSKGSFGRKGVIQSPTVLNSGFNFRQFWNGRAKNLQQQINGPINDSHEMGIGRKKVVEILNSSSKYKKLFYRVYRRENITYKMFTDAIAEFEKTLITPDCKFDLYLKGKAKLSKKEKKGYILFKKYGCITCHNGVNIGGNSFQKMGVIFPVKDCVRDRYAVTHNPFDKCVYKVPTLRNIALTAPYFHDGRTYSLFEAVQIMAYHNLGFKLSAKDAGLIVDFLKTLTGKMPSMNTGSVK